MKKKKNTKEKSPGKQFIVYYLESQVSKAQSVCENITQKVWDLHTFIRRNREKPTTCVRTEKALLRRQGGGRLVSKARSSCSQLRCNTKALQDKDTVFWVETNCPWDWATPGRHTASLAPHGNSSVWNTEAEQQCPRDTAVPLCHQPAPTAPQGSWSTASFLYKLLLLSTKPLFPLKPSKSFRDTSPSEVHTKAGALGKRHPASSSGSLQRPLLEFSFCILKMCKKQLVLWELQLKGWFEATSLNCPPPSAFSPSFLKWKLSRKMQVHMHSKENVCSE